MSPHSMVVSMWRPGLPRPCMPSRQTSALMFSVAYGARDMLPPLPWVMQVGAPAQRLAKALVMRDGTVVFSSAHLGVLGMPSSLPST